LSACSAGKRGKASSKKSKKPAAKKSSKGKGKAKPSKKKKKALAPPRPRSIREYSHGPFPSALRCSPLWPLGRCVGARHVASPQLLRPITWRVVCGAVSPRPGAGRKLIVVVVVVVVVVVFGRVVVRV
jgi:hypothetical protein